MGTRVCGKTCYHAKGEKCRCWCGGLFHGGAGEAARRLFLEQFEVRTMPTTEADFLRIVNRHDIFTNVDISAQWLAKLPVSPAV